MASSILQPAAQKKSQLQQNEQQNVQAELSNAQKIRVKLTRFASYFSGDMAPLGKWMKGKFRRFVHAFTQSLLKCIKLQKLGLLSNTLFINMHLVPNSFSNDFLFFC